MTLANLKSPGLPSETFAFTMQWVVDHDRPIRSLRAICIVRAICIAGAGIVDRVINERTCTMHWIWIIQIRVGSHFRHRFVQRRICRQRHWVAVSSLAALRRDRRRTIRKLHPRVNVLQLSQLRRMLLLQERNHDEKGKHDDDHSGDYSTGGDTKSNNHAVDWVRPTAFSAVWHHSGSRRADNINADRRAAWHCYVGDHTIWTAVDQIAGDVRREREALDAAATHLKCHVEDVVRRQAALVRAHAPARNGQVCSRHNSHCNSVRPLET